MKTIVYLNDMAENTILASDKNADALVDIKIYTVL
jgi:hypothetical protein